MKIKIIGFNVIAIGIAIIIMSASLQSKPWVIPDKYKSMKSTVKTSAASIAAGKVLWEKHCKSCHGTTGKGDGVKAKTLKTTMGDLGLAKYQSQADGVLYYQSFVGRDEMTNFEKKIPDVTDRWNIINFIRSLKK
ncbi:MAG: cytochrome c [Bacteroidota bacterium]